MKSTTIPKTDVKPTTMKLSMKEKISYGYGDLASNFVWGMATSYLLFFYTDIFGISAAAVGTLFLITRIWDALNDPIMGIIVDRTKSKHGKARPYLLYLAVPFGILSILTFITPNFSDVGKLIYAYVTYTLLGMIYTGINLPYGALMPMMTRDSVEKGQLSSFRAMGRSIGAIIVAALTLPLTNLLGQGNQQLGFPLVMTIYSIIGVILFLITFKNCKERVTQTIKQEVAPKVKHSIRDMFKNKPWVIVALNSLRWFTRLGLMNGVLIYYVNYVLDKPGMVPFYLTLLNIANLVGGAIAPFLLKRLGNKISSVSMYTIVVVLLISLYFVEGSSPIIFATLFFFANVLIGFGDPANLTMLGDAIDYQEWKFGHRVEGLLYSAYSFATKFGVAIGSAFVAYALGWAGYNPDALTDQAINMIRILMFGAPIILTALQIVVLAFYKLDQKHEQIAKELAERTV
ncbi:GPH family glycoside/pentoside/hexuronide:cation symporter [Lederbergia galactosidilyticus]|uniref:glycoside-pentoside-hexuronide (GPH):cation symporter n=1 Tax=Lederbergia galactosidilytica TaxID=217031 RepID=UPI001AEA7DEB|nr:glycoside-pentoside-hexuronide (GPH):cation symporter [Lederbergia galactosidilytica]MBP1915968.1 GPH family glycoside/pentoside/hexuronide:cation symporter [Lederbergia galactosidilytica]